MAKPPRVVAELGRPETPDEAADRKAESSRTYRSSQTTRNLIAALLATLVVVLIIVVAVPRGGLAPRDPIDVAAVASQVSDAEARPVIAPELSEDWVVNRAALDSEGAITAWTIVYAPGEDDARGFLTVGQGFDAPDEWPAQMLSGAAPVTKVGIGGVQWDRYEPDPGRTGNVSVALSAPAGDDIVLIYGAADDDALEAVATAVASEVLALREESP